MRPEQYLGIECPFCGAEFHRDREAAGLPCIVHPTSMETGKSCLLGGQVWIALNDDIGPLLLKISQRSEKIREWMEAAAMQSVLAAFAEDGDDDFDICEVCEKPLRDGDLVHACSDGPTFCEEHAPTWGDIRREYDEAKADGSFVDLFFDPEDAAVSDRVVDENIAAGNRDVKHVWPR